MPFANPTKENDALVAWDGTTRLSPRYIEPASRSATCFEVETTLTADAVFGFEAYDALSTNACLPDMATGIPETDKPICWMIVRRAVFPWQIPPSWRSRAGPSLAARSA